MILLKDSYCILHCLYSAFSSGLSFRKALNSETQESCNVVVFPWLFAL